MTASREAYDAAQSAAVVIDRSDRVRLVFTGPQARLTLNGLLTNDVAPLVSGHGHYAAALTNKGKVIADVRLFAREADFLVDTSAAAGPGLLAMLKKYVNPRLAQFSDASGEIGTIGVFGPQAAGAIASLCAIDAAVLAELPQYSHLQSTFGAVPCTIARVPDLGVTGFDLFIPGTAAAAFIAAQRAGRATWLDAETADTLRIEAGRPLWGTDMDENTLAQEAALDRADVGAISFDKGCYTGQETVARVHFRGHVNRVLRGLRCTTMPQSGARVGFGDNAEAGTVCSTSESPQHGAIALAYVRREIENGAVVTVRWDDHATPATVSPLPFD